MFRAHEHQPSEHANLLTRSSAIDSVSGLLLIGTMLFVIAHEWSGVQSLSHASLITTLAALTVLSLRVSWPRRFFLLIGLVLILLAMAWLPHWQAAIGAALKNSSFIIAFFTAITTLRSVAINSQPIAECGRFLAEQAPGRRYLALTLGGSLFGLILMYGAIALLGSLAEASALRETNAEIRDHRLRRMLIAIQRGFVATLPWSPLSFAMAVSTALVPGAGWSNVVLPCLVSGFLLASIGWALDTALKPKLSSPSPTHLLPDGQWHRKLRPLLQLLVILVASTELLHLITGVRFVGVVMLLVPVLALLWTALQAHSERSGSVLRAVQARAAGYTFIELPLSRSEVVLLAMAGFIGALGSSLIQPLVIAAGIDLAGVPAWALLLGLFWLIPISGQVGMNPILSVSLMAPLLPTPDVMGVSPAAVIVAITSGWALSGATSPFTASTLLISSIGKVSAAHVGLRWNGLYALSCALVLSVWIVLAAHVL